MKEPRDLKKGDLCVFVYGSYSYPTIFHSLSIDKEGSIRAVRGFHLNYFPRDVSTVTTKWLSRVQGAVERKVWKISEDNLSEKELENYKKWKEAYGKFPL